jgi:hypothetical protein
MEKFKIIQLQVQLSSNQAAATLRIFNRWDKSPLGPGDIDDVAKNLAAGHILIDTRELCEAGRAACETRVRRLTRQ